MKVRDSGMPEQTYWESLFDIKGVLDGLEIGPQIRDAAEIGCGYGTFTVPIAQLIQGTLYSYDIEPEMVAVSRARVDSGGVRNVILAVRDIVSDGFGLSAGSVYAVFLFNILHAENPVAMLHAAAAVVRPGGRVFVIHWRSDVVTPRGPALSIRPRPEQVAGWATQAGLRPRTLQLLPPWHFGLVLDR